MNIRAQKRHWRTVILGLLLAGQGIAMAGEKLEVSLQGLQGEAGDNARASLEILRQSADQDLDANRIEDLHQRAESQIRRALQPFGYYRPQIEASLTPPADSDTPWRASYRVEPGEAVIIKGVELTFTGPGERSEALIGLRESLPIELDKILDHRDYESAKRDLLGQVRELGYQDAEYTVHRVEVDLQRYTANIVLEIVTGPRYVYGPIDFQQAQFSESYLERYLILQAGDTYKASDVARQRRLLSASGHFSEVIINPGEPLPGANPQVPLTITLTPFPANRYRGRVGWGTDTGFGLGLDWTRRYLGSRGHQFNLGAAAAEERERMAADISYTIPLAPLSGSHLEISGRHESKDLNFEDVDLPEGGETRIATNLASLFWHMPAQELGSFGLKSTTGLSVVGESYDIFEVLFGNFSREGQEAIIESIGQEAYETLAPEFEAVVAGLGLQLGRSNDPLYIRRGDYLNLELIAADESLGSNISFVQARLSSWNIWPLGEKGRFLLRTNLGFTDAESREVLGVNFNQMPEYYEFRAGGARSVRGYGFETLFPSDAITGGKHLAVASVEYEHEIIPDWSLATFVDAGNAFNRWQDFEEKIGVGLGVRWRSPVGLARIDLGIPLDDADDSFQVYITVGPEF